MDFQHLLTSAQAFLRPGVQYGLLAGLLVGGITWAIINYPEYLFRGVFGLFLGFAIAGMVYASALAHNFQALRAAAGGPTPQGTVHGIIDLLLKMAGGGLVGALLIMIISAPRETILGLLFGAILGTILGGLMPVFLGALVDKRYFPAAIGLLTMIIFVVFGST